MDHHRERIMETFRTLIRTHQIRSITPDLIASKCHMSKNTLYKYFSSKEELIDAYIDERIAFIESKMTGVFEADLTLEEKINRLLPLTCKNAAQIPSAVIEELDAGYPAIARKWQNLATRTAGRLRLIIDEGMQAGIFSRRINPDFFIQLVINSVTLIHSGLPQQLDMTYESAIMQIHEIFLNGLFLGDQRDALARLNIDSAMEAHNE
jgi:AcrR family transcriptional regulator